MKKLISLITLCLVLTAAFNPGGVLAISDHNFWHVLNDAEYYNEEDQNSTVGGGCSQLVDTDNYPLRTPEITDKDKFAEAIDTYIEQQKPNSPYVDLGKYFVEGGSRAGINPILAVAIASKESSLGTDPNTTALPVHNGFGRTANANTQPHYKPGSRAWYSWESWQASLYSSQFPADGTVNQPDDIFQYIARVYGDNLDNGLEAFLEGVNGVPGYAPSSDGNDVRSYIDLIERVTNDIVELADGAVNLDRVSPDGNGCAASGSLIDTTLLYAWPDYRSPPYTDKKPEYDEATRAAMSRGEYVGGGRYPGVDCGGFVTRVMRDSGYDPSYNSEECNTPCQKRYLDQNWEVVNVTSTSDLQPGDVAMRTGHTFMYVGEQPGFETTVASASFSTSNQGWRAPMAGKEAVLDSRLTWYRRGNSE